MKRLLFFGLTSAIVAGCAGRPFNVDNVQQLRPGMTYADVQSLIGKPVGITKRNDGLEIWSYAFGTPFGAKAASVTFIEGKVAAQTQLH